MTSDRKIVTEVNAKGDTIRRERDRSVTSMRKYAGNFEWHGNDCVYNTATGHYDIKAGEYCRYVRDRLGSTVAVTDGAGNLVQTTRYYPSGTPYKLPASVATDIDAVTEKLHIGNKWIGHKGFDIYDNTARMHDPLLARFHTIDPLFGDYPGINPWTHCAANPANILDPDGQRPTDLEGAIIAEHIYEGKVGDKLEGNWIMQKEYKFESSPSFRGGLYSRIKEDGQTEYALAYAGTYTESFNQFYESILEDFLQIGGLSEDMNLALKVANEVNNSYGENEITLLGHSKGGTEAVGASLHTGIDAIAYNPAKINHTNIERNGNPDITNIIVDGELLTNIYNRFNIINIYKNDILQDYSYVGRVVMLKSSTKISAWDKHSIKSIINILKSR